MIKLSSIAALAGSVALIACGDDKSTGASSEVEFLELRVEEITATKAVVRFATSEPTTCEAEYGTERDALVLSATDPTMGEDPFGIDHNVPIEDLTPGTTYYYRARASSEDERTFLSGIQEFKTLAAPAVTSVNVALITTGSQVA